MWVHQFFSLKRVIFPRWGTFCGKSEREFFLLRGIPAKPFFCKCGEQWKKRGISRTNYRGPWPSKIAPEKTIWGAEKREEEEEGKFTNCPPPPFPVNSSSSPFFAPPPASGAERPICCRNFAPARQPTPLFLQKKVRRATKIFPLCLLGTSSLRFAQTLSGNKRISLHLELGKLAIFSPPQLYPWLYIAVQLSFCRLGAGGTPVDI